jgi:hypothetical protein
VLAAGRNWRLEGRMAESCPGTTGQLFFFAQQARRSSSSLRVQNEHVFEEGGGQWLNHGSVLGLANQ